MKLNYGIQHIIVGAVLFIIGGYLAYSFYDYEMGNAASTNWGSIILYSVISLLGLLVLIYGIKKMKIKK